MIITPISATALVASYTGTPASLLAAMVPHTYYQLTVTTACWIKQGTAPTAAAGTAGNIYVPIGATIYLDGTVGPDLSVVQDSATGKAVLVGIKTY